MGNGKRRVSDIYEGLGGFSSFGWYPCTSTYGTEARCSPSALRGHGGNEPAPIKTAMTLRGFSTARRMHLDWSENKASTKRHA